MKPYKFSYLIANIISLQLIISPVAADTTQNIMTGLELAGSAYNAFSGNNQNQVPVRSHVDIDRANLTTQQTPLLDKYFNWNQKMAGIPGLMKYLQLRGINPAFLNCNTLPTSLYEANNSACADPNGALNGAPAQTLLPEANAYQVWYGQITKLYDNNTLTSQTKDQNFGIGCMNKAMEILKGFFAYRIERLDFAKTALEAKYDSFIQENKENLKKIREDSAILEGESSPFAAEFTGSTIFKYGDRLNQPACASMMSTEKINELGKKEGTGRLI